MRNAPTVLGCSMRDKSSRSWSISIPLQAAQQARRRRASPAGSISIDFSVGPYYLGGSEASP